LLASFPHFALLLLLLHLKNSPSPAWFSAPSMLLLLPSFLPFSCLPLGGFSSPASRGGERRGTRRDRPRGTLQGRPRMPFVTCAATATGIRAAVKRLSPVDWVAVQQTYLLGTLLNPFEPF
jgi:hypothetical protein